MSFFVGFHALLSVALDWIYFATLSFLLFSILDRFLVHYHDNPMQELVRPLKSNVLSHVIEKWYVDFIEVDQEQLFDLMQVADYLNIKPLLDLCAVKVRCYSVIPTRLLCFAFDFTAVLAL